ncbi:MAG: acetoin dehydrogenase dihydrolipoyllysine-residue acetyltransferase subunit [Rhizobiales bacterium]|nr:acetoin dehydrogenase dihydrolipoyllysine-residue acetyltransferase subunit [Hyphomicrobiales bacterium]
MAEAILVPQVGQDLTEAKVVALHVKIGDQVKKGDVVAEVESEKASFEVEAFSSGTVTQIAYKLGDTATVLQPLLFLGAAGEKIEAASSETTDTHSTATVSSLVAPTKQANLGTAERHRSSPLARRLASTNGLDIARVSGSGPRGAVVFKDIEALLKSPGGPVKTKPQTTLAFRSLRDGTGTPVIFIHGFGAELAAWRPFVETLTIANQKTGLDLPGHGASPEAAIADFDELVDAVAEALTEAGHTRLNLVGHSLGAAVAAALAARDGFEVKSLSLVAPAGLGPKINGDFIAGFLAAESEAALKSWMQGLVHRRSALPQAMVRATLAAREGTEIAAAQKRIAAAVFSGSTQLFSIRDALEKYQGPCRIIVGREDAVIPAEYADAAPDHIAVHKLSGIGHLPQLEAAALVGRLVSETVRAAG